MDWGLFTCGYQRLPLEKAFEDAAAFGYDYIELWGGYPHAYAPDLAADDCGTVLSLIDRYRIPVRVYTPEHNAYPFNYMLGSERQWRNSMDYLFLSLSCAKKLGAEKMLISVGHGGSAPEIERRQRLMSSLRALSREASRLELPIVLETLTPFESNSCTRLSELCEVLEELDSPFVLGMCDVAVPFVQGEDPADYARLLGSRMAHLHFVDNDGESDTHLIPGEGKMNLKKILSDFRCSGYDGTATLELVTNYTDDPTRASGLALERAKELLI